ncbi:hypothetical protein D3C81_2094070 [compost metagenome]
MQGGVIRRERQGLLQAGLGIGQLALLLQGQRQPAVGLRLLRFGSCPFTGQGHALVDGVAAQGFNDLVLHGGPA